MTRITNAGHRKNLLWFRQTFAFELLPDKTGRYMEPAFDLKNKYLQSGHSAISLSELTAAADAFSKAPVEELFRTFAAKAGSRGELGELSSLNQKLWSEYQVLKSFLEQAKAGK